MAAIPVNVVTGFLGSGKTTLLRHVLADASYADCAVLINELGEIGIDHHLIEQIDGETILMRSGCVCCTIRDDLAGAIRSLHERREAGTLPPFRRLIIETTGLADPTPVLATIMNDVVIRHHFRLGNVITTVDAVNGIGRPEAIKQVAVADRLVLTKTDLAPDAGTLLAQIRRLNPDAPLWRAAEQAIDAAALLDGAAHSPLRAVPAATDGPHGSVHGFALSFEGELDWTMFGVWLTMLLNRHGEAVLRVKGILNVAGSPTPVAIHGVQHLVHPPVHMTAWPDGDRSSRLVFIVDGIDRGLIERSLRAFLQLAAPSLAAA